MACLMVMPNRTSLLKRMTRLKNIISRPAFIHTMTCSSGVWDKQETRKLIEIWGEDNIQSQLEGCHRNKEVYQCIDRKMGEEGFERTFVQCREKVRCYTHMNNLEVLVALCSH